MAFKWSAVSVPDESKFRKSAFDACSVQRVDLHFFIIQNIYMIRLNISLT